VTIDDIPERFYFNPDTLKWDNKEINEIITVDEILLNTVADDLAAENDENDLQLLTMHQQQAKSITPLSHDSKTDSHASSDFIVVSSNEDTLKDAKDDADRG
jgi:hypothetical protein